MNNRTKVAVYCLVFWLVAGFACCAYCQVNQQFGQIPRVVPRTFTFSQVFPVGNKDYIRNAFVKVVSGADTSVFFIDYYGNSQKVVGGGGGGNGIYGGSGTVPPETVSTLTETITFNGVGDYDFAEDAYPVNIVADGNEPGLLQFQSNGGLLNIKRADVEFIVDGVPSLQLTSSIGNTSLSASGFVSIEGDSVKVRTSGGNLAMTIDESQRVGIGTTNPDARLTVRPSIDEHGVKVNYVPNLSFQKPLSVVNPIGFNTFSIGGTQDTDEGHLSLLSMSTQSAGSLFSMRANQGAVSRSATLALSNAGIFSLSSSNGGLAATANGAITLGGGATTQIDAQSSFRTRGLLIQDFATITGTGGAIVLSATIMDNLYKPGSTQTTATFVLPPTPSSGQLCRITFFNEVGSITWNFGANGSFGVQAIGTGIGSSVLFKFFTGSGWCQIVDKV